MTARILDINCDMGEGFGNWRMSDDAAVLPLITTANLACGFHAGDPLIMMETVRAAREAGVAVGAHPGLPDLAGFGRRVMALSAEELHAGFAYQIGALQAFLTIHGMRLNHVKPHGALFHVLRDPVMTEAALDAITAVAPGAAIYWVGPLGREVFTTRALARGMRVCAEAYPDLDYADDGSLLVERRKRPVEPALIASRITEILTHGTLTNRNGVTLPMQVESVCIHSDGPNVQEVLAAARGAAAACGARLACATA
ncbi:MAG: hypothetical protein JWP04_388 [Belnapia sp.]|jgi:UPF0271 protein|nr:hypothetical protein [Belnapia sp.]